MNSSSSDQKLYYVSFRLEDRRLMGFAIGRQRVNLQRAQDIPGIVRIGVDDETLTFHVFAESPEAAEEAREILEIVQIYHPVQQVYVGRLIGAGGHTIREIVEQSGASLIQQSRQFWEGYVSHDRESERVAKKHVNRPAAEIPVQPASTASAKFLRHDHAQLHALNSIPPGATTVTPMSISSEQDIHGGQMSCYFSRASARPSLRSHGLETMAYSSEDEDLEQRSPSSAASLDRERAMSTGSTPSSSATVPCSFAGANGVLMPSPVILKPLCTAVCGGVNTGSAFIIGPGQLQCDSVPPRQRMFWAQGTTVQHVDVGVQVGNGRRVPGGRAPHCVREQEVVMTDLIIIGSKGAVKFAGTLIDINVEYFRAFDELFHRQKCARNQLMQMRFAGWASCSPSKRCRRASRHDNFH